MGEVRIEQAEKKRSINRVVKGEVGKRKEKRKQNGKVTRRELLTKARIGKGYSPIWKEHWHVWFSIISSTFLKGVDNGGRHVPRMFDVLDPGTLRLHATNNATRELIFSNGDDRPPSHSESRTLHVTDPSM